MLNDPIVDEVRKVRDELSKKFNYDVDAIFADLREKQNKYHNRIVNLKKLKSSKQKDVTNELNKDSKKDL